MQDSVRIYKFMIAGLVLAIMLAAWLVIGGLFASTPEDATPRTAVERLITDAALAAKRSPDSIKARLNLVRALATAGNYSEALAQARQAEKLDAGDAELAMLRGSIYARLGDTNQAEKWLKKAAKQKEQLGDFYAQVYTDLAKVYEDEGRLDEALRAYDRVLEYTPISATAYQSKARIYELKGKTEEALNAYKTAYEYDTQDKVSLKAIERLSRKLPKARTAGGTE